MNLSRQEILNPVGNTAPLHRGDSPIQEKGTGKPVVGLLNNSKPNVSFFLDAVGKDLQAQGYRTVNVTKPRSAGPCPDVDTLSQRCDYVVNAVAD
jgi:hypothetical protein